MVLEDVRAGAVPVIRQAIPLAGESVFTADTPKYFPGYVVSDYIIVRLEPQILGESPSEAGLAGSH